MTRAQKFFQRLRNELGLNIPDDAYTRRTGAGRHQRSAGAWTSTIRSKSNPIFEIGLWRPVAELVRCPNLETEDYYGLSIDCGCKGSPCEAFRKGPQ
jgi:hypothetical protein